MLCICLQCRKGASEGPRGVDQRRQPEARHRGGVRRKNGRRPHHGCASSSLSRLTVGRPAEGLRGHPRRCQLIESPTKETFFISHAAHFVAVGVLSRRTLRRHTL